MLQVRLLTTFAIYKAYDELQDTMPVLTIEEALSRLRRHNFVENRLTPLHNCRQSLLKLQLVLTLTILICCN